VSEILFHKVDGSELIAGRYVKTVVVAPTIPHAITKVLSGKCVVTSVVTEIP